MLSEASSADVCLILEGTYPYALGGVASWTHELISMQDHLTFSILAIISPNSPAEMLYELPRNVVNFTTLRLQRLPKGSSLEPDEEKKLFDILQPALLKLQSNAGLDDLRVIIETLAPYRGKIGHRLLLDSPAAWDMLHGMYRQTMPQTSFLDYFWSWRGLFGGLFSVLLGDLPPAKCYHALCTGYAGLMLARAHLESGRPCLVTEHGIYTNERRIEISSADWIDDPSTFSLAVYKTARDLKDLWIDTFSNYSRFCYEASDQIITLYEGNLEFQRMDGAAEKKLRIVPNGIDATRYPSIPRGDQPPSIALIGRIVPIKDVKTYIKAVHRLKQSLPELRAYVLGPADEDPGYANECYEMAEHLGLKETLIFTGQVKVEDYLNLIDVIVLTSLSEAQPLVILEAGAAGIPTVATDVGACREMIMGSREHPNLGPGGAVVPLGSPSATADALFRLLTEKDYYQGCSRAIAERVRRYYSKADQRAAYTGIYQTAMERKDAEDSLLAA